MSLTLWIFVSIGAAVFGAYCSALALALQNLSAAEMAETNMPLPGPRWLLAHRESVGLAASLWRRASSLVLVLAVFELLVTWRGGSAGAMEANTATITLVIAAAISFLWLWLVDTGLAWGIALHMGTPLIRWSLPALPVLHIVSVPLVAPLRWVAEGVRRMAGVSETLDPLEQELRDVAAERKLEGDITATEHGMIEAIAEFRAWTAGQIMTPRIDIESIELSDDLETVRTAVLAGRHSRFPVYVEDIDHIQGVLYAKDLLPWLGRPKDGFALRPLLRRAVFVPESRSITDLLQDFKRKNVHIAVVLDEYGGTAGLVTIEDVIEQIFGDIRDEYESLEQQEAQINRNADGTADVDARLRITELNSELKLSLPDEGDYDTVGGWVLSSIGRIPSAGERLRIENVEVTILQAQRTHIGRMRLRIVEDGGETEAVEPASAS